jgi:hypothetical protein
LPEHIDQKVYIPFSGAWSEIIGFLGAGYEEKNIYGCEINPDYIEIGQARQKFWSEHNYFFKEDKPKYNEIKDKVKKTSKDKNEMKECNFNF